MIPTPFLAFLLPFLLLITASPSTRRPRRITHSKRSLPRSQIARAPSSPFIFIPVDSAPHLPLTRLATRSEKNAHIPSQVLLQQHINKSVKRHARMTKRDIPSDADLHGLLIKRWETVQVVQASVQLEKRQRGGYAMRGIKAALSKILKGEKNSDIVRGKGKGQGNGNGNGNGNGDGNVGGTAGVAAAPAAAPDDVAGTTASGAGFSEIDFAAATDDTVDVADAPTGVNSLGLDIEANDVGYFATVQMGTPARDFKLLMDSGSADLWVPSTACQGCGNHQQLGSDVSSSFVDSTTQFQVTYGSGNVAGVIAKDDISISTLKLAGLTFGVTTTESIEFSSDAVAFDGIMGLAQSTLSNQGVPTAIEFLAAAGTVPSAQIGYRLARLSDGTNDGQITFGGVDATKFTGGLTELANVNTNGFWEGALEDVSIDGTSLGLAGRTAILDTGTTLIIMPAADAAAVHAAIPGSASDGQGGFTVPCTTTAKMALTFGGKAFAINPTDLTFLPVTADLAGDCVSGISAGQVGGATQWLIGDVFLKNVYFATDVASNSIGLAPSVLVA